MAGTSVSVLIKFGWGSAVEPTTSSVIMWRRLFRRTGGRYGLRTFYVESQSDACFVM